MMRSSRLPRFLTSKVTTAVAIILVGLLMLAFFRDKVSQEDLSSEIGRKEGKIEELEGERIRLVEIVDKLESADYIEREARLRLGLVRPGEKVVSVSDNARPVSASTTVSLMQSKSNARLWLEYFFGG